VPALSRGEAGEVGAGVGVQHGSAAERDDRLLAQRLGDHLPFDRAEGRLALAGEDLIDRAVTLDDALVGVDEGRADGCREPRAHS
jgi:hypothetical protein